VRGLEAKREGSEAKGGDGPVGEGNDGARCCERDACAASRCSWVDLSTVLHS